MLDNIQNIIDEQSCYEQGSLDWFRARLGNITSSKVSMVMLAPKPTKSNPDPVEKFTDTAKGYLYQVAAERNLRPQVIKDDEMFNEYLQRVDISSRTIRYGSETEAKARKVYSRLFADKEGYEVVECGFIRHTEIDKYGDSPDGVIVDINGKPVGTLEIKCPKPDTFIRYSVNIKDADSLKEEKPEYYWQCQSHCLCNNVEWCDFVFFDIHQSNGIRVVRIYRNDEDIAKMIERIKLANDYIDNTLLK